MQHLEARTWTRVDRVRDRCRGLALAGPLAPAASAAPPPLWETDGSVSAIVESGGTVYLGGSFSYVGPHTGSGVVLSTESGAVDPAFPQVEGGGVLAAVADGAGGWFIGGDFTSVGGVARRHLAHIRADGTLDPVWNPSADGRWWRSRSRARPSTRAGPSAASAARAAATSPRSMRRHGQATAWNPNANGSVCALAVSGSTVYAGGDFTSIGGEDRNNIAALDAQTGKATAWNPNADDSVSRARGLGLDRVRRRALQQDRRRGSATTSPRSTRRRARRPPGTRTRTASVLALAVSGSTVYAGGAFSSIGGERPQQHRRARCADGQGDRLEPERQRLRSTRWRSRARPCTPAGSSPASAAQRRNHIAALDAQTGKATAWNPNANGSVYALAVSGSTRLRRRVLQQRRRREPQQHRRARRADGGGDRLEPERGRPSVRRSWSRARPSTPAGTSAGSAGEAATTSPPSTRRRARRPPGTRTRTASVLRARGLGLDRLRRRVLHQDRRRRRAAASPRSTRRRARRPPGTRTRTTRCGRARGLRLDRLRRRGLQQDRR